MVNAVITVTIVIGSGVVSMTKLKLFIHKFIAGFRTLLQDRDRYILIHKC